MELKYLELLRYECCVRNFALEEMLQYKDVLNTRPRKEQERMNVGEQRVHFNGFCLSTEVALQPIAAEKHLTPVLCSSLSCSLLHSSKEAVA